MIGSVVAGRFALEAEAGAGGMGTVYRARDLNDGAEVAVKILTGRELREAARFDQEAVILAGLTHPAIVRYLAHGITPAGQRFIVMEWLDGEDLCTRLERKAVTIAETVALARRAAEALAYAHVRNIVHRNIKPENLFLPGRAIDRLKVLDFGIARLTRGARKLTATGAVVGTPGYMGPVQTGWAGAHWVVGAAGQGPWNSRIWSKSAAPLPKFSSLRTMCVAAVSIVKPFAYQCQLPSLTTGVTRSTGG